jgi:hypothetical protein
VLTFDNSVTFSEGNTPVVGLKNFWEPEDGFVWSTGKWCEIGFPFQFKGRESTDVADLMLEVDSFKVEDGLVGQNLLVYLNGLRVGSYFCTSRAIYIATFDAKLLKASENILTIDTPDSASPRDFGMTDNRLLGLKLFSLQIRKNG